MRASWHPIHARLYGIRPWEMQDLTMRELKLINKDVEEAAKVG